METAIRAPSGNDIAVLVETNPAVGFRTHPDFPQFTEDIGLVRCWQVHGWPPQIQPKPGTDGSHLQFSCR